MVGIDDASKVPDVTFGVHFSDSRTYFVLQ